MNPVNQVNPSKLSYRAEIDGLRAIAVLSVILYHAQMVLFGRVWFEGGFIGVDIFFVVSGYLITRIILSELQSKGSFSFLNFYERRARRILPILFVVIFASVPYAWQKLLPSAFVEYAASILSSLFFGSNFFFYFSTTKYGAASALLKPFLHTWSLGVEEQFYLVFPVLAILAFKYFRAHFLTIIVALSLLSLQFAEFMAVKNSDLHFYLPFSRFWELAVGSMLAYRDLNYKTSEEGFSRRVLPILGLYLVVYSILFFDGETPHPSFHTLIPILGVALIIGFASKDELVGKILGSRPFVWIGLISYSAYLWHFPIFAFSRMGKEPNNYDKLEWILVTLVLSVLSYLVVEKPFRRKSAVSSRALVLLLCGALILAGLMTTAIIKTEGFKDRFPKVAGFENYEIDNEKLRQDSWSLLNERIESNPNFLAVAKKVLLVGNSHAKDLFNALVQNDTSSQSVDVLLLRANLPQVLCANEEIAEYALVRDKFYASQQYKEATTLVISTRYDIAPCDKKKTPSSDIDGLKFLIKRAKSDGKQVVVFGNTAEFKKENHKWVVDYVYDLYKDDDDTAFKFESAREEADKLLFANLTKAIDKNKKIELIATDLGAVYFDKASLVCDLKAKSCTAYTDKGFKTLYDYGHWTLEGAKFFGERLLRLEFLKSLE